MSDPAPEQAEAEYPGTQWDAPNQQVVRPDESPPWQEGTGGSAGEPKDALATVPVDEMTKQQLLDYARSLGVSPANNDMTKEELRAGIDAKQAEATGGP